MPKLIFNPGARTFDVDANIKVLVVANRNKVGLRFGCASCRCGTCAVQIEGGTLSPMQENERALLTRMDLPVDGTVRLACQTRIVDGTATIDLDFQNTYSPDQGDDDDY